MHEFYFTFTPTNHFRYKLIRYEADDAKANLRPGADHFIEVGKIENTPMISMLNCHVLWTSNFVSFRATEKINTKK